MINSEIKYSEISPSFNRAKYLLRQLKSRNEMLISFPDTEEGPSIGTDIFMKDVMSEMLYWEIPGNYVGNGEDLLFFVPSDKKIKDFSAGYHPSGSVAYYPSTGHVYECSFDQIVFIFSTVEKCIAIVQNNWEKILDSFKSSLDERDKNYTEMLIWASYLKNIAKRVG